MTIRGLSVIIPTLDETPNFVGAHARRAGADEVIVPDGGSADDTSRIARQSGARIVQGARGRGP